jgi:hypothetical protein
MNNVHGGWPVIGFAFVVAITFLPQVLYPEKEVDLNLDEIGRVPRF